MSDQTQTIRIVIDARPARDGGEDARRSLKAVEDQTGKTASGIARVEEKLASMGGRLKAFAVTAAIAWGTMLASESLAAASGLDELADQLGVTTKTLQALQFSAVQNGAKLEQLETGVSKFSQKIGEAAGGSKEMIGALDRIGVKILDMQGRLRPTETILVEVSRAISNMQDPASKAAAAVDFFGKSGTRLIPTLKDVSSGIDDMADKAKRAGAYISQEAIEKLDKLGDAAARNKLSMRALFAESTAGPLAESLDFLTRTMEKLAGYVRAIRGDWSAIFTHNSNSQLYESAKALDLQKKIEDAEGRLAKDPGRGADRRLIRQWQGELVGIKAASVSGKQLPPLASDPDGIGIDVPFIPRPGGASNPHVTGAGDDLRKRLDKLDRDSARSIDEATKLAEAAKSGSAAVAEMEMRFKALKAAQDAYGDTAKDNAAAVEKLTEKLEAQFKAEEKLKNVKEFRLGTADIERENQLMEAELRLANALPEVRARELAVLKTIQEVRKRGIDDQQVDIDQRIKAVEQQELLKQKIEETKKSQELWTAPIKNALQSIQSSLADFFDNLLQGGINSFSDLASAVKNIWRRMLAELLAVSVMRPLMGSVLGFGTATGTISPGIAQQLGYGGMGGGGGFSLPQMPTGGGMLGGGSFGGLSSIEMPSWLGGGAPFSFLNNFISPPSGAALGGGLMGPAGPGLGGLTWGNALGGIGSIGMGAFNLLSGNGSTASTIGGIGQMVGGAMMMIPGMQPIGMGISLLSSILPGLFGGGSEPPIPPQPNLVLSTGNLFARGGRFEGSGYGEGGGLGDHIGGVGNVVSRMFRQAGVTPIADRMYGGSVSAGVDHVLNGRQWSDRPYTNVGLIPPGGGAEWVTNNDSSRNLQQATDVLIAALFKANVLRGGVSGASPSLIAGLKGYDPQGAEDTQNVITLAMAYDRLGKAANPVKDAIDQLSESFDELAVFAEKAGLSMDPINQEIDKKTKRTAQDFIDSMLDPLSVQMRALQDEKETALESAKWISENVKDVYVDMNRVVDFYTKKQAQMTSDFYGGAIENLQALIDQLKPGGAMSNLGPTATLAGLKADYDSTTALARANDPTAIANYSQVASEYLQYARPFYAGSAEYNAIRDAVLATAQELQAALQIPTGSTAPLNTGDPALQSLVQQVQQLMTVVSDQAKRDRDKSEEIAKLTALLSRYVTARGTG